MKFEWNCIFDNWTYEIETEFNITADIKFFKCPTTLAQQLSNFAYCIGVFSNATFKIETSRYLMISQVFITTVEVKP